MDGYMSAVRGEAQSCMSSLPASVNKSFQLLFRGAEVRTVRSVEDLSGEG